MARSLGEEPLELRQSLLGIAQGENGGVPDAEIPIVVSHVDSLDIRLDFEFTLY
jgi:hypothetical protein